MGLLSYHFAHDLVYLLSSFYGCFEYQSFDDDFPERNAAGLLGHDKVTFGLMSHPVTSLPLQCLSNLPAREFVVIPTLSILLTEN